MPRDHLAARRAVVDKHAGAGRLEAQHRLLAGIDQGQLAAAEPAGCRMEVDIVRHGVGLRVHQREFDVVAIVNHHERARDRAIEGHGLEPGTL